MNNYSNFCRDLKQDLISFLNDIIFTTNNISRPIKKFILELLYGVLSSGSTMISNIARSLNEDKPLIYTEKRLADNLEQYDLTKLNILTYVHKSMLKSPITILIDETDIIKPFGFKFEDLGIIHDGSKEGRPREKGYNVTGIVGIGFNNTVIPIILKIYSSQAKSYISLPSMMTNYINKIVNQIDEKIIFSMDRGYDGKTYINPIESFNQNYIVRAKENRKYVTSKGKFNIIDICNNYKGKYSSTYVNSIGRIIYQKFSAIRIKHKDFNNDLWLIIESVNNEKDKRVYLTNMDCSNKDNCIIALKSYRLRWRIEEFFRFVKGEYSFEKFRVRSLMAANNLSFIICLATLYISHLIIVKNSTYYHCMSAYKSFNDRYDENNIVVKYGTSGLELYRIKNGIQEILSHSKTLPEVPGYKRTKEKYHQLTIDEIK